jgi:hypothetical protein
MTNWRARLEALERSRGTGGKGPVVLFHEYGTAKPVVPPGYDPVTIITEVIVDRIEPDGTEHVIDPWNPAGPVLIVRPGEPLPDRTPPEAGRVEG